MTDTEIKKALEICGKGIMFSKHDCKKCPYYTELNCETKCKQNALDLINRLQAENRELKQIVNFRPARGSGKSLFLDMVLDNVRTEAYKDCIEKVKALFPSDNEPYQYWEIHEGADNLLKELVGEDK